MTLEFWTAVGSVGTLVVISATAVIALLQLRHMRAANQVAAIQTFFSMYEGPDYRHAFDFVRTELPKHLEDPKFRAELRSGGAARSKHPEMLVCNFFDQWGAYYRSGVIDRDVFMQLNAGLITGYWRTLQPVVMLNAERRGGNTSFQNFEMLAVFARQWLEQHPAGDYPKGVERIELTDPWREIDKAY
jgi:hypothetical protein